MEVLTYDQAVHLFNDKAISLDNEANPALSAVTEHAVTIVDFLWEMYKVDGLKEVINGIFAMKMT